MIERLDVSLITAPAILTLHFCTGQVARAGEIWRIGRDAFLLGAVAASIVMAYRIRLHASFLAPSLSKC